MTQQKRRLSTNVKGGLLVAGLVGLPLAGYLGNAATAPARQAEAQRVMINVAAAQRTLPKSFHADFYGALLSVHRDGRALVLPEELALIESAARRAGVHPSRVVETLRDTTDRAATFKAYDAQIKGAQENAGFNNDYLPETGLGRQMFAVREILGVFQGGRAGALADRIRENSRLLRPLQHAFGVGQGTPYGHVVPARAFKGPVYLPPREQPKEIGGRPVARPQPASRGSPSRGQVRRTQNRGGRR